MKFSPKDHGLIVSNLRRAFSRSDHRYKVLNKALSKTEKGPRGGKLYKCAGCGELFNSGNVHVDHIKPIVPLTNSAFNMKIETILKRMWCPLTNLQVLCKECHKEKTSKERRIRAKNKKKRDK